MSYSAAPLLLCRTCGGARSPYSVAQCRACYRKASKRQAFVKLGGAPGTINAEMSIHGGLAETLLSACAVRKKDPAAFLADIIETVLRDNLVDAVMDDAAAQGIEAATADETRSGSAVGESLVPGTGMRP